MLFFKPKNIVRLEGGLGNQMFQYAFAKKLAATNNQPTVIDTSKFYNLSYLPSHFGANFINKVFKWAYSIADYSYGLEKKRNFGLNKLSITLQQLSLIQALNMKIFSKLGNKINIQQEKSAQQNFMLQPHFLSKSENNQYFIGYFQSKNYLNNIEQSLKTEFMVRLPQSEINNQIMSKLSSTESVFIHVRRTDFVSEESTSNIFAVTSKEYFVKAIEYMNIKLINPIFIYFSDDIQWVKDNLPKGENFMYSENDAEKDYEDLRLMYNCKHAIISNSSFSWWGATLILNPSKIVVAPTKWLNLNDVNFEEIYFSNWVKL